MSLIDKIFGEKRIVGTKGRIREYIDLEEYIEKMPEEEKPAEMLVRVGEVSKYEDLKEIKDYIYGGNLMLIDFSPLAEEEVTLKRITDELKKVAEDVNCDIAGIGNNLMIVTPKGVKIDRRKIRGSVF
jgi:hypothetical protein